MQKSLANPLVFSFTRCMLASNNDDPANSCCTFLFKITSYEQEVTLDIYCDWWSTLFDSDCILLEQIPKLLTTLTHHMYTLWYMGEETTFMSIFNLTVFGS